MWEFPLNGFSLPPQEGHSKFVIFIKILISALLFRISDFVASNAQTQIAV
jgi:hypothetical protein